MTPERKPALVKPRERYVPALGFHWLTALYDPMIRAWSAATRMRRSVIDAMELQPGMRVLELGAGPGRLAIQIKRAHPDVAVEAVDVDIKMVARARRNAAVAGVDVAFREADMTQLPELGTFDRVYSTMTFHHLRPEDKQAALAMARRVLRPGGSFVVADFNKPRGPVQWALFTWIQQPLDGFHNTTPHRDGRYERNVRDAFGQVRSAAVWKTVAGTVEMFVCSE
ncbi:MAG TPA: methyltransferase domain-containing protein [Kofleriaceae bacterium]